jgi:hypothetical protein
MYMFDKNGIEVVIGDYVYFNDNKNRNDSYTLNTIGKITEVNRDTGDLVIRGYEDRELYERSLYNLQRLPETVWSLLILEKDS